MIMRLRMSDREGRKLNLRDVSPVAWMDALSSGRFLPPRTRVTALGPRPAWFRR